MLLIFFGLGLFCFSVKASADSTFYVTTNPCAWKDNMVTTYNPDMDACTGGTATAFNSVYNALCSPLVTAGDTIFVADGTYSAMTTVSNTIINTQIVEGGSPGKILTIKSRNKHGAKIKCDYKISSRVGFYVYPNVSYVNIEGFDISDCFYAFRLDINNDHVTIKNNKMHDIGEGVSVGMNSDYAMVDGNIIYNFGIKEDDGFHGMHLRGKDVIAQNNLLYNNLGYGWSIRAGADATGPNPPSYGTWKIINNTLTGRKQGQGLFNTCVNLYGLAAGLDNLYLYNNICFSAYDGLAYTDFIPWRESWEARNNLVENSSAMCKGILPSLCANCTGARCRNNITNTSPRFTDRAKDLYALATGSAAINTGLDNGLITLNQHIPNYDINGAVRPRGDGYDIGAYERNDTYYASPDGTGDGSKESSPFKIADFWPIAAPGDKLYLLDGVYQGDKSMISPLYDYNNNTQECASYKGGTEYNPIVVKTLNDGKVTIDGQGARKPVYLLCQRYLTIEGINARNSNGSVFTIIHSDNNIIRRSVGWDAYDGDQSIFVISAAENNLLEDVAGFGIAKRIFSSARSGDHTTIRRAWGSWDGSHEFGPKMTYTLADNNYDMTCENCIGTWTGSRMQESYALKREGTGCYAQWNADQCANNGGQLQYSTEYQKDCCFFSGYKINQPYAVIGVDGFTANNIADSRVFGSISYIKQGTNYHIPVELEQAYLATNMSSFEYKNAISYIQPGLFPFASMKTFALRGGGTNLNANNLTGIGGAGSSIHTDWHQSKIKEGPDVSSIGNVYVNADGASICKRYRGRVLTDVKLWPWPMNQRIIDATTLAGIKAVNVTATIEGMFGPIPAECGKGVPVPTDIDNNGSTNIKDIQATIGCITNPACGNPQTDVNADGKVNIKDIQQIIKAILNL